MASLIEGLNKFTVDAIFNNYKFRLVFKDDMLLQIKRIDAILLIDSRGRELKTMPDISTAAPLAKLIYFSLNNIYRQQSIYLIHSEPGLNVRQLASRIGIAYSQMVKLLSILEKLKFIIIVEDKTDLRGTKKVFINSKFIEIQEK